MCEEGEKTPREGRIFELLLLQELEQKTSCSYDCTMLRMLSESNHANHAGGLDGR